MRTYDRALGLRCFAGLAGEGGGEVSPVVNADLAEDGLGVVAHGVRR